MVVWTAYYFNLKTHFASLGAVIAFAVVLYFAGVILNEIEPIKKQLASARGTYELIYVIASFTSGVQNYRINYFIS